MNVYKGSIPVYSIIPHYYIHILAFRSCTFQRHYYSIWVIDNLPSLKNGVLVIKINRKRHVATLFLKWILFCIIKYLLLLVPCTRATAVVSNFHFRGEPTVHGTTLTEFGTLLGTIEMYLKVASHANAVPIGRPISLKVPLISYRYIFYIN